ncbi:unnamed protein product [Medioppia subpectinata]|uniref:2',5'-phosphodiesterase 12 n=1 Tax=Medioppia subpectinata TaxID=1979941 RepID=A0A7R9KWK8_9ACAR|nr:unnamed protein product [Medioppia subpectinata]CAG2111155.1 unnamed protein product [Medioppia subpectinata]
MDSRCDVRCVECDDSVVIEFVYTIDTTSQRSFHFKRDKNETLRQTFARIALNINKSLKKKTKTKSKTTAQTDADAVDIHLISDGVSVSQDSANTHVWKSGQTLVVGVNRYNVFVNAPTVKWMRLLKVLMSSFKIYPIISLEFCSLNECQYYWFRESIQTINSTVVEMGTDKQTKQTAKDSENSDWVLVGEGFYYETTSDDIGSKLKVVCHPLNGRQCEAISENPIEANPGLCPFEERTMFCQNAVNFGSFRIVSYNILANIYADQDYTRTVLFPYCPPYALAIDYRKQLLLKEITGYKADIYCLQEVDKLVFDADLKPIMSSLYEINSKPKYESIFSEKGNTGEGLAAFVNTSKFEILSAETVCLSQELQTNPIFAQLLSDISVNEKLLDRLMARYSVIQCILCMSLEDNNRAILLGNTHLYFHPDADHIRLIQSYIYVKYIENKIKILSKKRPELKVSPILCGDYNSCPEFGVFQLMTTDSDETIDGIDMHHSLSLDSACGQPVYTNYTPGFSGCLDYIFFDTNQLEVSEVIPMPSHEQVVQNMGLPSIVFPSDHLALISVLKWKTC